MRIAFVSFALAALAAVAAPIASADATLSGNAVSGREVRAHLTGTMAPKGSFEEKASSSYTKLADYRDSVTDKLIAGKISVDFAQAAQTGADAVRGTLDNALRACAQDNHTGKCTGDGKAAEALLKVARAKLKRLH